jgi:hypothetical protein
MHEAPGGGLSEKLEDASYAVVDGPKALVNSITRI